MQRFKSPPQAQRFLSAHAFIYGHFHLRRRRTATGCYRTSRVVAFKIWQQETCAKVSA
jgi:putative transposase